VSEESLTFEAAQKELESIVEKLERGEAELEQLTELSERGEVLYRFCREKLDTAHGKIEELAKSEG
jgi:exodeoxyribonuclease VII small subunit